MTPYRTKADLVISVDDTDNPDQGGTGRVARAVADRLGERFAVWGVTRHQLAVLPEINYTRNNSANVVHLLTGPEGVGELVDEVESWVREMALSGSEPGLCVADPDALRQAQLGRDAQTRFVHRREARAAARTAGVVLRSVGDGDGGTVGAFAAACLAAQGDDGRFVQIGEMRALSGEVSVADVRKAGADEVRALDGVALSEGTLCVERLRPALRGGRCVLYCSGGEDGLWTPIMGGPGDPRKGETARVTG
jgi:hypothetical protein